MPAQGQTVLKLPPAAPGRLTQSLGGPWQIADSKSAFAATVPVPGLANLAKPAFPDVDKFISRENMANKVRSKLVPAEWLTNYWTGKVDQDRGYFWYRKTSRAPAKHDVPLLKINKAQFGNRVRQGAGSFPAAVHTFGQRS